MQCGSLRFSFRLSMYLWGTEAEWLSLTLFKLHFFKDSPGPKGVAMPRLGFGS